MGARDNVVRIGTNRISHTGQSSHNSTMEIWEACDLRIMWRPTKGHMDTTIKISSAGLSSSSAATWWEIGRWVC